MMLQIASYRKIVCREHGKERITKILLFKTCKMPCPSHKWKQQRTEIDLGNGIIKIVPICCCSWWGTHASCCISQGSCRSSMWLCYSDCVRGDRDNFGSSGTIWAAPTGWDAICCHCIFNTFLFDTYLPVSDLLPYRYEHIVHSKTGDFWGAVTESVTFRFSGSPEDSVYWYKVLLASPWKLILCFLFPNLQLHVVKTSLVLWTMYRPCPVSWGMTLVPVHITSLQHGASQ